MYQLFIFIQTFSRYQRHDIDVSIDVITLKALQCTNRKIFIALMTLMLRMNCTRHDSRRIISLATIIDVKMTSNLKLVRNAVMSFNSAAVKVGRISG